MSDQPFQITATDQARALRLVLAGLEHDIQVATVLFSEIGDTEDDPMEAVLRLTMAIADVASVGLGKALGTESAIATILHDLAIHLAPKTPGQGV